MSTHQNFIQRTEVGIAAVMGALGYSTLNALICVTVHSKYPPFQADTCSISRILETIPDTALDLLAFIRYNIFVFYLKQE